MRLSIGVQIMHNDHNCPNNQVEVILRWFGANPVKLEYLCL